jgi:hypothetical protein
MKALLTHHKYANNIIKPLKQSIDFQFLLFDFPSKS